MWAISLQEDIFKVLFIAHWVTLRVSWWARNKFIMQIFPFVLPGERLGFPRAFVLASDWGLFIINLLSEWLTDHQLRPEIHLSLKGPGCLTHLTISHSSHCAHAQADGVDSPVSEGRDAPLSASQQGGPEYAVIFNCFSPCFVISSAFLFNCTIYQFSLVGGVVWLILQWLTLLYSQCECVTVNKEPSVRPWPKQVYRIAGRWCFTVSASSYFSIAKWNLWSYGFCPAEVILVPKSLRACNGLAILLRFWPMSPDEIGCTFSMQRLSKIWVLPTTLTLASSSTCSMNLLMGRIVPSRQIHMLKS